MFWQGERNSPPCAVCIGTVGIVVVVVVVGGALVVVGALVVEVVVTTLREVDDAPWVVDVVEADGAPFGQAARRAGRTARPTPAAILGSRCSRC